MAITKKSILSVTLKDGSTILAKITKIDAATGKVSWADLNGAWRGSLHISRAVEATVFQLNARELEKEALKAIADPIIAAWSFGPQRRGPLMREGYYFSSVVFHNGKRVGKIVDRGDGGEVVLEFVDRALASSFEHDVRQWVSISGGDIHDGISDFWSWMTEHRNLGVDAAQFFAKKAGNSAHLSA